MHSEVHAGGTRRAPDSLHVPLLHCRVNANCWDAFAPLGVTRVPAASGFDGANIFPLSDLHFDCMQWFPTEPHGASGFPPALWIAPLSDQAAQAAPSQ